MDEARSFFSELDFRPVNSSLISDQFALQESSMLGGRYCSIKGIAAAQLRYQNASQGVSTLYEVAYDRAVFGDVPNIDGGENVRSL